MWVGGNSSEDKQFLMYNVENGGDGGPHQIDDGLVAGRKSR